MWRPALKQRKIVSEEATALLLTHLLNNHIRIFANCDHVCTNSSTLIWPPSLLSTRRRGKLRQRKMCGIVGIVARGGSVDPDLLERATQSLAHRGPDHSGTVIIRENVPEPVEIGLGNRRLAILDLSPLGHQPMHDAETGNWIAYNGEIYNFQDIRRELERSGTNFISHSDTEVVLKAYARWGEDSLKKFRGMFAFALWDARQHRLFMARDPMGVKPLYYAQTGSFFIFASEVRSL